MTGQVTGQVTGFAAGNETGNEKGWDHLSGQSRHYAADQLKDSTCLQGERYLH